MYALPSGERSVGMIFWGLLLIASTCRGHDLCPVWTTYNSSTHKCECGSSLGNVVRCDPDTPKVSLLQCYCMTYSEDLNTTVVGTCLATCFSTNSNRFVLTSLRDVHELNQKMCGPFKRTGQLCGECVDNYSVPVYFSSWKCTKCNGSEFKRNLVKYLCAAFLPLTLFYFIVILFKVSITSGNMVGYILVCQALSTPLVIRSALTILPHQQEFLKLFLSCLAVWNLDFFYAYYTPLCIHPRMHILQVEALTYLVAVYPLLLIFLTYMAVSLHDRYSIVVKMWRPAYSIFIWIRKEWNIRGSLVQAFASFMVLSYTKILYVSLDILRFVNLHDVHGEYLNQTYVYLNAEMVYFGREHLPYGVLAIAMLTIFNLLPVILLLLYPCRCFQRCLNRCRVKSQLLHTFMDAFQGCYRHKPRDCRYFAGIYLGMRIMLLFIPTIIKNKTAIILNGCFLTMLVIIIMVFEPNKMKTHNKLDSFFLLLLAMASSLLFAVGENATFFVTASVSVLASILLTYGCLIFIQKIIPEKLASFIRVCWERNCKNQEATQITQFEREDENSRLLM